MTWLAWLGVYTWIIKHGLWSHGASLDLVHCCCLFKGKLSVEHASGYAVVVIYHHHLTLSSKHRLKRVSKWKQQRVFIKEHHSGQLNSIKNQKNQLLQIHTDILYLPSASLKIVYLSHDHSYAQSESMRWISLTETQGPSQDFMETVIPVHICSPITSYF